MLPDVRDRLLDLNHQFYISTAQDFDQTRRQVWPGLLSCSDLLARHARHPAAVLDAGCGNGRILVWLHGLLSLARYTGLDSNRTMLHFTAGRAGRLAVPVPALDFVEADLASDAWRDRLPATVQYDLVLCLATLHHLPGLELRRRAVAGLGACLRSGGLLVFSNWQPSRSPRERGKFLDWTVAGLAETDVEEGDRLVAWRRGRRAMRYVHETTTAEMDWLGEHAGCRNLFHRRADGVDGRLNLYSVYTRS